MTVKTAACGIDRTGFPCRAQSGLTARPWYQICLNRLGQQPPYMGPDCRDVFAADAAGDGDAGPAKDAPFAAARLPGWRIAGSQAVRTPAWFAVSDIAIDERAAGSSIPRCHRLKHVNGAASGQGQVDARAYVSQEIEGAEYRVTRRPVLSKIPGRGATAGLGHRRYPLRCADRQQCQ